MVNVLIGNKNVTEANILCQTLANDKEFKIENTITGFDTISKYWQSNPDILVLDNSLSDMNIPDILNRLSCNEYENQKCNTILTLNEENIIRIRNVSKVNSILYKPLKDHELIDTIKMMSAHFYIPTLELGEVDLLLQELDSNYMSGGYKYMRDAIYYCYYKPEELEFLRNILKYLSFKYVVPESRIRDSLNSYIRTFNHKTHELSAELSYILNCKHSLSLKEFLEKIVFYLIRKKGRLF